VVNTKYTLWLQTWHVCCPIIAPAEHPKDPGNIPELSLWHHSFILDGKKSFPSHQSNSCVLSTLLPLKYLGFRPPTPLPAGRHAIQLVFT
jgi:hypothetical protein